MTWSIVLALALSSSAVLLAVWLMFRLYFRHQTQHYLLEHRATREATTLPLRLQAYERLILLFERIDIVELVLRLKAPDTTVGALKSALLLAVQQEFEHNLTQQLYVTDALWKVLLQARMKTLDLIIMAGEEMSPHASGEEYAKRLIEMASAEENLPAHVAIRAIKTESTLWL